ncbi:MAG: hypothetical protein OXM61_10755, partial [Candidatus Poribacteria bacterium]|nr:hypothetical protein [Candidatus Poribacteria bacterium]
PTTNEKISLKFKVEELLEETPQQKHLRIYFQVHVRNRLTFPNLDCLRKFSGMNGFGTQGICCLKLVY